MPAAILGRRRAQSMCSPMSLCGASMRAMDSGYSTLLGPPRPQSLRRLLLAEGSLVEPEFHEERQGAADDRAGTHPEDFHDLVAGEIGPQAVQLFLLAQLLNAGLQLVHAAGQGTRLAGVAGGAVTAGQLVEGTQQVAGVAH